jgi:hypothetical protein
MVYQKTSFSSRKCKAGFTEEEILEFQSRNFERLVEEPTPPNAPLGLTYKKKKKSKCLNFTFVQQTLLRQYYTKMNLMQ